MGQGQDRPLAFIGDSIVGGWGACRAEAFARHGFPARGISGWIRAETASYAAVEPTSPPTRAGDAVPTR